MALPNSNPSPSPVSCLFTGKYLEQMLDQGADDVYVFGRDLGTYETAATDVLGVKDYSEGMLLQAMCITCRGVA